MSMEFFGHSPNSDIVDEPYYGTNEAISGLGYGAVETKFGIVGGVVAGAGVGALAGERVTNAEKALSNGLTKGIKALEGSEGAMKFVTWLPRITLRFCNWLVGVAKNSPEHLLHSMPKGTQEAITKNLGKRFDAALIGAGLGALVGMVAASITGAAHGANVAYSGRVQHSRAKNEIKKLRNENQELSGKVQALQEAHSASLNELAKATPDEAPTAADAEKSGKSFAQNLAPRSGDWAAQAKASKEAAPATEAAR
jgi:hypothetical protein